MNTEQLLRQIDAVPEATRNLGASPDDVAGFEMRSDLRLTDELREFYQACNGATFHDTFVILSLSEAEQNFKNLEENGNDFPCRVLPILRNDVWNTVAVCCDGALRGYYVHLCWEFVDFSLKWRSLESFLTQAMAYCHDKDDWNISDLQGGFGDERTTADIVVGRELLRSLAEPGQVDVVRQYKAKYGCELLGAGQLDEMAELLADKDFCVARDARDRIGRLGTVQSRELIEKYWENVRELLKRTALILETGGFRSTLNGDFDLRTEPGKIAWNWEALYSQQKRADYDAWVLSRAQYFAELQRKAG